MKEVQYTAAKTPFVTSFLFFFFINECDFNSRLRSPQVGIRSDLVAKVRGA